MVLIFSPPFNHHFLLTDTLNQNQGVDVETVGFWVVIKRSISTALNTAALRQ